MKIPDPKFDKNGNYDLSSMTNRYHAAINTLKIISLIGEMYNYSSDEEKFLMMEGLAKDFLRDIDQLD